MAAGFSMSIAQAGRNRPDDGQRVWGLAGLPRHWLDLWQRNPEGATDDHLPQITPLALCHALVFFYEPLANNA
ncbi:MAG: hypothetical protein ACI8R4_001810 [Paracoccaceae bacterium]